VPVFRHEQLVQVGIQVLQAVGCDAQEARIVSESLVESNLVGHDSHGVVQIPAYVERIKKKEIVLGAKPKVIQRTDSSAVLDGNWGLGQIMGRGAMELAMELASSGAIGAVTLRQSSHVGRLGEYPALAAAEGQVGIALCNGHGAGQGVAPFGGSQARLHTAPISVAIPAGEAGPVVLDFSTAATAEGKIRVARNKGVSVPEGYILDGTGQPTTDPAAFYGPPRGALLPFGGPLGGHKGFGLAMAVEMLSGILSGAQASCQETVRFGNAMFLLAVNIEAFLPMDEFTKKAQEFVSYLKGCPRLPGFEEILVPGEVEAREKERRLADGISVDPGTWARIQETAGSLNLVLKDP
jgi:uncharacterized oxidoreductase